MKRMQIFEACARGELTPEQAADRLMAQRPRRSWWLAVLLGLAGCQGCAQPAPPTPVVPAVPGDASPCAVIQAVDQARLIRLPDGGTLNEPCADE